MFINVFLSPDKDNKSNDLEENSGRRTPLLNPGIVFISPNSSKKSNTFYQK